MTKEKQMELMRKNLRQLEADRGRIIFQANQNPDGWAAQAKEVLVRKYTGQIKALKKRMAALRKN